MSKQDGIQPSTKQRRSRRTSTAVNQQNGKQTPAIQRPANDDNEAWKAYWKTQGQPWRTEPEIDVKRQKYLVERRSITPNIEKGIYPFKGIELSRADIEWLLATHENGRGPVNWSDESQRQRNGLDLRGAFLRQIDLRRLPLACTLGGLRGEMWNSIPDEQLDMAAIHFEGADLREAHLEEALLDGAYFEGADLRAAHLVQAIMNAFRVSVQVSRRYKTS